MKCIKLTKNKSAIVDDECYNELNKWRWHCDGRGYAARTEHNGYDNGKRVTQSIKMHRQILRASKGVFVDHINGDKLDNRRSNLRFATTAQNNRNSKTPAHNSSGYKGVYEDKRNLKNKWQAYITVDNKKIHLGYFYTKEDAAKKYNDVAKELFGEYARVNNIVHFEYEYLPTMELVREQIKGCESRHTQQIAYSSFHDCLTQICFGCRKIRTNKRL